MSGSLNRVKEVVTKVRNIQHAASTKEKGAAKYITDRCNKIALDEHKRLDVVVDKATGEMLSKPVCTYRYYSQLMEDYRNGIKALGFKHHSIDFHIKAFVRKYGSKVEGLSKKLDSSLDIKKLRDNLILLRADSVTGSEYRSDLLSLKIEHHAFYMFEPKGAIKDWIRDDDKKQLTKKLHNQILVNPNYIPKLARDLLTAQKPSNSDLCIGLALATGRRLTEVMKTAKFKAIGEQSLSFSGQLKMKNRHLFETIAPYDVPAMIEPEIIVKALKTLRKATGKDKLKYKNVLGEVIEGTVGKGDVTDYYHNKAVHKKYESTMNRAIRSILKNGHFSLKDCRALYTEVTYSEHSQAGEARSAYRHRVLGHSIIETQLHYDAFEIDESVETIKLCSQDEDSGPMSALQEALLDYLVKADGEVMAYARAPKIAVMHEWLKNEVSEGLEHAKITASYIRRNCLFDGKQLNLNTIKKYVNDFLKIELFEPPKEKPKKPKNKKEREILELNERLEEIEDRTSDIRYEREVLDAELANIAERQSEIKSEDEDLEHEKDELDEELEDLQARLDELNAEADEPEEDEYQEIQEELDLPDVPENTWPDAKDISVQAKKDGKQWHVWAEVNDQVFEQWTGGTKISAIKGLREYYQKSII